MAVETINHRPVYVFAPGDLAIEKGIRRNVRDPELAKTVVFTTLVALNVIFALGTIGLIKYGAMAGVVVAGLVHFLSQGEEKDLTRFVRWNKVAVQDIQIAAISLVATLWLSPLFGVMSGFLGATLCARKFFPLAPSALLKTQASGRRINLD